MVQPGLYIHIPFCKTKCGYCDFFSVTSLSDIPEYVKALLDEISLYINDYRCFDTIYIGGGTPSLLSSDALSDILNRARDTFAIDAEAEITLEINPADADPHFLTCMRQAGVNRLSLGIQSFDDPTLRFLERRHTPRQARQSIAHVRAAGYDNIGLDLIYGIPGQCLPAWKDTLFQALSFGPEHLSCYQLSLEDDTPLRRRSEKGEFELADEDGQMDFFMTTADILEEAGYLHYEVSNFARADRFKSRHNQKYWRHTPYLGCGAAAHSLSGKRRWWNLRSIKQYILELREGRRPVEGSERITPAQKRLEACFLGLRTGDGIPLKHFLEQQEAPHPGKRELLDELVRQELIVIRDDFLKPTRKGLAVADRLALIL